MDAQNMERIAKEVLSLYGTVKPWSDIEALPRIARHFAGYLPDKVVGAVKTWATEHPDKAPKPAELLDLMRREHHRPEGLADPERCPHPQPWALMDERSEHDSEAQPPISPLTLEHPVGTRIAMCTRCHTEFIRKPGTFQTEGETEERDRQRQEARHG